MLIFITWFFSILFIGKYSKQLSLYFSLQLFIFVISFWILINTLFLDIEYQSSFWIFNYQWNDFFNIYFVFGMDNISLFFLLLTTFLIPICLLISWNNIKYKSNSFVLVLFIIELILFNLFCTLDLVFFYLLFESILIPMFILIGVWGSRQRKIHAVYQFFFYTLTSSLFMLLGLVTIYSHVQSTDLRILYTTNFSTDRQLILWFSFFLAFCVKVPLFPFHIRLPEAHVEAPTVGSVILAGVLLKMGTYGILKFVLVTFCDATFYFTPVVYLLCVLGIVYTCGSTIRQIDLKKIIAYSSVSHMSFVILGLFSNNLYGITGSIFLMLSHGITSSGLFFCVGCLYDRYKTRVLRYYSGLVLVMPLFCLIFFVLILSNISFPGTSGFIGELLILLGLFIDNTTCALISTFSIIWTTAYSIWLYNRVVFNNLTNKLTNFSDLSRKEFRVGLLFSLMTIYFGLRPATIISLLEGDIYNLLIIGESQLNN